MLGSSPLGNTSLGNSDDSSNNIIFNAAFTQITASDAVQQIFSFDETAQFIQLSEGAITQTFGTQSFPSTISENTIGETTVSGTLTTAMGLYQYDFEAFGLQIGVNDTVVFRPALREFFTEIAAPIIAANDSIQQKFIFDTQLNINLGDFDIAYEFEGLTKELKAEYPMLPIAPISANAIGEIQWEGEQDFQPSLIELTIGVVEDIIKTFIRDSVGNIQITATDNQGPGVVRPADGVIEYPHFRPVLRVNAEDNITIEIDLIDDPSSAYAFPSPGIDRLIREPGLPLGPLTVSTISEEQYEGVMDFQPSLLELTLDEPSPIEVIIDYPEDIGTLELDVDQTIVFRPALREFFTETAPLSVAALDSTYLFTYPLLYSNVSPGLPIGPITVGSIAEEQIILGSLAELYEYTDILPLLLSGSGDAETNRIEVEFNTTAILIVDSTGLVTARYPRDDSVDIAISSSDVIGKKFVFVDTLTLEIDITETIRSRQVFRSTIPVRLNAVATVKNVYDIEDAENLEIKIPASQKFRYQTPAVVIPLEVDTTVSNLNIYKPFQGRKFRKTFSVNQTLTVGATQRQYNIDFNANTTSIIELQELVNDLNSAVNRSGYTLRNQNLFLSFWKNGIPQFAIRQSSVGSATNPTRYTFNKPRFNYNYNNTTNVGTLIWDTNPQSDFFTLANATFNGVTYNRTTTNDFEFDEIRMYSGDVANSSSLLLWSGGLPAPAYNLNASTTQHTSYFRETQLDIEIAELGINEISYTFATSVEFEIGETHLNEIIYNFTETIPILVNDLATQSSTRTFVETATFSKLGADSTEITSDVDTALLTVISATDEISVIYSYQQDTLLEIDEIQTTLVSYTINETVALEINETHDTEIIYNSIDNIGVEVDVTESTQQLFVFDDTIEFEKLIVDSFEIVLDYDTVVFNTFDATDNIEQLFVFKDNTNLEIAASSPEIISEASTLEIEIAASETVEQLFVFDDTAQFTKLGVDSFEITLDYDTIVFNAFAAIDNIEQLFVYDDTAEFIKLSAADISVTQVFDTITASTISISDVVTTSLTNSDFAELEVDADIVLNLSEGSVGSIEIDAEDQVAKVVNTTSAAPLIITSTVNIQQLFVFDDTAQFTQINADTVEVALDYDTVLFNAFAATDSVEQLFVFDDTATFAKLGADSIEIIRDYDTVVFNTFEAVDAIETLHVVTDSVGIEVTAFSPEIISESSTLEIEIAASETVEQLFVFDDTGEFVQLGVESVEITLDYDTVVFNAFAATDSIEQIFVYDDTAEFIKLSADSIQVIRDYDTIIYPEISAVDILSVVSNLSSVIELELDIIQAIGITEVSTGVLIIGSTSTQSVAYTFDDTAQFVKLGASSEEVTITSIDNVSLEISVVSTENITYVFDDTAQFVNVVVTSTEIIRDYDTLLINSFDVETITSSTLNRIATIALEIEPISAISVIYNIAPDTIELEFETTDTTSVTYNYTDAAEFAKFVIEDIDYVAVYDTITASSIEAVDSVNIVSNIVDQAEVIIDDASTQSFTYVFDDSAEFVKLGVTSTEISVNIENEGTLEFTIQDEISFVFAITTVPYFEIESEDDISKSVSDKSTGYIEVDANTFAQGYTLFQQIYANDTIGLKLIGQGDGLKITGAQQISRQIWIG